MGELWEIEHVPVRSVVISAAALAIPVTNSFFGSDGGQEYEILLWLLALVPAFLLAYHRGWRGAATALAAGMATLSVTQAVANYRGGPAISWPLLFTLVALFIGLCLGIGWMAEALHRERARAHALALTDDLTRLPNRRYARMILDREFAAAIRGRPLSVVLFDIDHFKAYNDVHGHQAGDDALRAFAAALDDCTRRMNLSARVGGEEFLSIVSGAGVEGTLVFVERVRNALERKQPATGRVTVSAGVATFAPGVRTVDDLIAAADFALYKAKSHGRNCVRVSAAPAADESVSAQGALGAMLAPAG